MQEKPPSDLAEREAAAWERVAACDRVLTAAFVDRAQAVEAAFSLARFAGHGETAVLELAGTLRLSQRSADGVLTRALQLHDAPAVGEAMGAGRMGQCHGFAMLDALVGLPARLAEEVAVAALDKIDDLPPARVRDVTSRLVMQADPAAAARRRVEAVAERTFGVSPAADGMAWVRFLIRAQAALRIAHRAEEANLAGLGDGRSADQRRVDWVVNTLLGPGTPGGDHHPVGGDRASAGTDEETSAGRRRKRPTQVLVHVPVAVALGHSEDPAELGEYGPIDAELARILLTGAELRKVCVDERTGDVLAVEDNVVRPVADPNRVAALGGGLAALRQAEAEAVQAALLAMVTTRSAAPVGPEPGYRPSARLSRAVKIRSVRCDGVGCSQPARHCDDEHTIPYPRGQTSLANLKSRSRRCHRAKQAGWTPTPIPGGGTRWVSPCGRIYFVPSPHAPPPKVGPKELLGSPRLAGLIGLPADLPVGQDWVREPPVTDDWRGAQWASADWDGDEWDGDDGVQPIAGPVAAGRGEADPGVLGVDECPPPF